MTDPRSLFERLAALQGRKTPEPKLADLLRKDISPDFPVASGNGKADDPLVITETLDYASVEYAVIRHCLGMLGEDWAVNRQRLLSADDRVIDMVVVDVKGAGQSDWKGCRRFYFDITAGFNNLAK